jgi:GAF domain-containing protein
MESAVVADEVTCDVAATFVRLADTLVDDYDVVDFASKLCRETRRLLDADATAVMLVAGPDELQVFASTSEDARALEFLEVRFDEGPSIDAYRTGSAVVAPDLTESLVARPGKWGRFGRHAIQSGFRAVSAVPMWVRGTGIGALSLYDRRPRTRPAPDLALAEGLADIASIGIVSAQRMREERVLAEQLQRALDSRVVIEQAKGTLAERFGVHVDEAFVAMRARARSDRRHLSDVARDIVADRCHGQEFALPGRDARRRAAELPSSA